jgi:hypothetical protein
MPRGTRQVEVAFKTTILAAFTTQNKQTTEQ